MTTTRELAITEGKVLPDGRQLRVGALKMHDVTVPITWAMEGHDLPPIGRASNFFRNYEGDEAHLFVDVEMFRMDPKIFPNGIMLGDFDLYAWCTNLLLETLEGSEETEDIAEIFEATIRCIQLVPKYTGFPRGGP